MFVFTYICMNNIYFVLICPCLPYVFMYIYMRAVCMYVYKFPHMDVCMHARTPADCLYKHSADNTRSPTQDRAVIVFEALGHFKECSLYVSNKHPLNRHIDRVHSRLTPECSDANTCRAVKTQHLSSSKDSKQVQNN